MCVYVCVCVCVCVRVCVRARARVCVLFWSSATNTAVRARTHTHQHTHTHTNTHTHMLSTSFPFLSVLFSFFKCFDTFFPLFDAQALPPSRLLQLYQTPKKSEAVKRDKWWGAHFGGVSRTGAKRRKPSAAYQTYRQLPNPQPYPPSPIQPPTKPFLPHSRFKATLQ